MAIEARPSNFQLSEELLDLTNEGPDVEVRLAVDDQVYEIVGLEYDDEADIIYINAGAALGK